MFNFITYIRTLKISGFTGDILLCRFDIEAWSDNFFELADINLPVYIKNSVIKRRAHYLTGRILVKILLNQIGITDFNLINGSGNEPLWPENIIGSLSHTENYAICAIDHLNNYTGIGVDIQKCISIETANKIWPLIMSTVEKELLITNVIEFPVLLTIVFSAKESLYKALYSQVKSFNYFNLLTITKLDFKNKKFVLELKCDLKNNYNYGDRFEGDFQYLENNIITFISY